MAAVTAVINCVASDCKVPLQLAVKPYLIFSREWSEISLAHFCAACESFILPF